MLDCLPWYARVDVTVHNSNTSSCVLVFVLRVSISL